ncbi:hypothetical protein PENSTE_c044G01457 [Penicillium steckii]|uniref:Uncharacterized protein n=1 Tax=Penicillium steckii TaxID=303698 RepID=A0A1V6SJB0_9EURO|nr:hypothetical protein PENSTE_c044G01457 [Penicillium steckii]
MNQPVVNILPELT